MDICFISGSNMMASGRMIRTQISLSTQVNDLSLKAALLFTWLIPHVDDFGRISADARFIKAKILPMRDDVTLKEIPKLLSEIESKGLIILYTIEDEYCLQVTKFEKHQAGLSKRTKSKLPPPEPALNKAPVNFTENPGISRKVPSNRTEQEQELEQEQEQEEKGKASSPAAPQILEIFEFWKKATGHEKAVMDDKREAKIKKALKSGYSIAQLKTTITGYVNDPWSKEHKKSCFELTLMLRDSAHIERFLGGGNDKSHVLRELGYVDPT